jgi:hypothetical protein
MVRFLTFVLALAALAAGYVYFVHLPRQALTAIERAAAADDVRALADHLDLESIRAALLAQFAPGTPRTDRGATALERIGSSFNQALEGLVGGTVSELVATPEGVLQLLGGVPLRPVLGGAAGRNSVRESFARARIRYEWPPALVLAVPTPSGDPGTEFLLRPRGAVWKMAEVRFPGGR